MNLIWLSAIILVSNPTLTKWLGQFDSFSDYQLREIAAPQPPGKEPLPFFQTRSAWIVQNLRDCSRRSPYPAVLELRHLRNEGGETRDMRVLAFHATQDKDVFDKAQYQPDIKAIHRRFVKVLLRQWVARARDRVSADLRDAWFAEKLRKVAMISLSDLSVSATEWNKWLANGKRPNKTEWYYDLSIYRFGALTSKGGAMDGSAFFLFFNSFYLIFCSTA